MVPLPAFRYRDRSLADGITITVQTLESYITRIRRKSVSFVGPRSTITDKSVAQANGAGRVIEAADSKREKSKDPLANVRDRQGKRSAFDYRPELADPQKLI
jgi:hypothetical protein